MKIVSSFFPPRSIQNDLQAKFPNIEFQFNKNMNDAKDQLREADVLITFGEDLTDEIINEAKKLKWIMVASAGLDKMPFSACKKRGILVTNARGVHRIPMAEYTIGMMLQYVKQMKTLWQREKEEHWDRRVSMGELNEKTILILGVGAIGGEIARLAKAFGMNTLGVNRSGRAVEYVDEIYKMNEVLQVIPRADFVVSVLPSTKETVHLLTDDHFCAMKTSAVFINIGRGDLVEERVLLDALENEEIAHAYLDVFENEPLPAGHPFWKMEHATVTPHLSSITSNYLPRSFEIFERNLHTYIKRDTNFINKIDLAKGY